MISHGPGLRVVVEILTKYERAHAFAGRRLAPGIVETRGESRTVFLGGFSYYILLTYS